MDSNVCVLCLSLLEDLPLFGASLPIQQEWEGLDVAGFLFFVNVGLRHSETYGFLKKFF